MASYNAACLLTNCTVPPADYYKRRIRRLQAMSEWWCFEYSTCIPRNPDSELDAHQLCKSITQCAGFQKYFGLESAPGIHSCYYYCGIELRKLSSHLGQFPGESSQDSTAAVRNVDSNLLWALDSFLGLARGFPAFGWSGPRDNNCRPHRVHNRRHHKVTAAVLIGHSVATMWRPQRRLRNFFYATWDFGEHELPRRHPLGFARAVAAAIIRLKQQSNRDQAEPILGRLTASGLHRHQRLTVPVVWQHCLVRRDVDRSAIIDSYVGMPRTIRRADRLADRVPAVEEATAPTRSTRGMLVASAVKLHTDPSLVLSPERRLQLLEPEYGSSASEVVIGSKMVLGTRAMLTCLLWCLKMAVFDLLARLISKMPYERIVVYSFWSVLLSTFVASIITIYVGCRPFERHWQIYPDPGECVIGNMWLITYESSNIVTDLMLMALSFTLVCSVTVPIAQRLRVMALFSIGIFLVTISIIRIMQGKNSRVQRGHTLWASLEILLAVVVAVTPTIYALAHGRHEDSSFDRTHLSEYPRGRTFSEGTVSGDKHKDSLWTVMHDDTLNRLDSSSSQRALIGVRHESLNARIV
ncbi:hypothetical protein OPT61_g189 [Boeremia exigua]|uniref:Uncharacterized protein n=1 Tax=Boeremia exigua TaxID=749465 RepID=A0ACC2IUW7_9PLEO|nr:hypothetical protein OPT61_g189 [Boeremia exigua]